MKLSLSNRIGVIIAASLIIALSSMLIILLSQEHDQLMLKTEENVKGLSSSLRESIVTAMDAGTTDLKPLIDRLKKVDNVASLKFKTSPSFSKDQSGSYDDSQRKVLNTGESVMHEEVLNGTANLRIVEPVRAAASCLQCHDGFREGETLAVIDMHYSLEKTEKFLASQRLLAAVMAVITIIITYLLIMYFIRRRVLKFILESISKIELVSGGIHELTRGIEELSKGNLETSFDFKTDKLDFRLNNELDRLASDVNSMIDNFQHAAGSFQVTKKELSRLVDETAKLTSSAIKGNLDDRADAQKFNGVYKELLTGINNTLQAISVPIKHGSEVLHTLASGDFTARMNGHYRGINLLIQRSINSLAGSLNDALLEVTDAVQAAAGAAQEISASSEQMAAGLQDQSKKTNDIASAIEEISRTIFDGTKNTSVASANSQMANENAFKGAGKVNESRNGMVKIFESTKQTSSKISQLSSKTEQIGEIAHVINEIADQTNLLALNAAIEAARAGEQGLGFAVVADEVRKLAVRTTEATHEISETISQIQEGTKEVDASMKYTEEKVNEGMHLMEEVAASLKEILQVSSNVNKIIARLTSVSEEQANAAEKISSGIGGISCIAQQSAAGTTQMAKAAEDLTRMTKDLKELVGRFHLSRQ